MTKVSVIVPVYNVEKYLRKCLDSLVNQTLDDYEVIVVNDGSPDHSEQIIEEYEKKYPNKVKGYKKENGGLSDARNYGLKYAKGEYISFIDSDDYVDSTMLEKMYQKASENNFDLVVCDLYYTYPNQTLQYASSMLSSDLLTKDEVKKAMTYLYPAAWNKLYKRELFDSGVKFKKGVWFEDVEFIHRLFPYINSIGVVKEPLIYYVQREGAITKTFDKRLYHYIDNFNGIIEFYKKNNFYDEYEEELEYCYVRYLYCTFLKQATHFDKKEFKKAVHMAQENVTKHFPNYRKNPYLSSKKGFYMKHFNSFVATLLFYFNTIKQKRRCKVC